MAARFKRPTGPKIASRAEFEQTARDLGLSYPELYGLLTGRVLSAEAVEARLKKLEVSRLRLGARRASGPQDAETQAGLPIGPSCC
jgi:hypothetical protein